MPFLWAAYRLGWRADGLLADGVAAADFDGALLDAFAPLPVVLVVEAAGRPQGLFTMPWATRATTVHATWLPWAKRRVVLAAWARVIAETRASRKLLIFAQEKDDQFFQHLAHYGLLRGRGKIDRYFDDGPCVMFVSAGEPEEHKE